MYIVMISLMDIALTVFVISTSLVIIMMMRMISDTRRHIEGLSYSEIYSLQQSISKLREDLRAVKSRVSLLEAKLSNERRGGYETKELVVATTREAITEQVSNNVRSTEPPERRPRRSAALSKAEVEVLSLLMDRGEATSSELSSSLGKSREHISRVLKMLYSKGYVVRIETSKPYRYRVNPNRMDEIRELLGVEQSG